MSGTDEKNDRDRLGRFARGNPGKKPGTRHKTTMAIERMLAGEAKVLTRKLIDLAKNGDAQLLKVAIDRLAPPRKGRPIIVKNFPTVTCAADVPSALATILEAVATGEITSDEGDALSALCSRYVNALEAVDLEARIKSIEDRIG